MTFFDQAGNRIYWAIILLLLSFFSLGHINFGWAQTPPPIPQGNFTKYWVDSEQSGNPGEAAFDGNTATFWHTQWQPSSPPHPHSLQVDLGGLYSIGGIQYQSRDAFFGANGRIGQYEVYVATNSGTPPTIPPVLNQWTLVASGVFQNNTSVQQVTFNSITSRYVWLRALTEAQNQGKPWTAVGEFNVLGTASSGQVSINPTAATVSTGAQQQFSGSGGTTPYSFTLTSNTSTGATVNSTTGLYMAGSTSGTSTVQIADSSVPQLTAQATVTVTSRSNTTINILNATVQAHGQQQFTGRGGTPCSPNPYAFIISTNQSGGTIGFTSGLYTAGPNAGTDTIRMADCSVPEKFDTATVTVTGGSGPPPPIPQGNFTKYWVDSEQSGNPGEAAFDGSTSTFWHTQWSPTSDPLPNDLQVDLGNVYSIGGIRYQSRDASF